MSSDGDRSEASERGERIHAFFLEAQDEITSALSRLDGEPFLTDTWTREEGGGGRSRVLSNGQVFEKAGVNVSCVHGELSEAFARELPGEGRQFLATGISLVLHPRSPHVPTVHANFRYLEKHGAGASISWFGGGSDLTPWIVYDEDAVAFHRVWRDVCVQHGVLEYARAKAWCDEYFYLPHREETRGLGGIFFDYLGVPAPRGTPAEPEAAFRFVQAATRAFVPAYVPIVERRRHTPGTEEERRWQLTRRGRYVEFNLVYDRGTIFGLKTKGRIESILMSLPPLVRWAYDERPEPDSYQSQLVDLLRSPRDWLAGEG